MAITKGHGNPNWTREETTLALELYFKLGQKMPSSSDSEVVELSKYLRSMDIHRNADKNSSFRNPDGIAFKVGNLRAVATGKGLKNTSKMDQVVWDEFGTNVDAIRKYCDLVRLGVGSLAAEPELDHMDDGLEFNEGKVLTRVHKTRERNRGLRNKLIKRLQAKNECHCEMCGVEPRNALGILSLKMFECHHIIPVSESMRDKTKLSDLSLLCANCHRLLHAVIAQEKKWLRIDEASSLLGIIKLTSKQ
jgi:5-methylcytosine-specific restriction protein A